MRRILLVAAVLLAGCGGGDDGSGDANARVTVGLDFTPNPAHAGIYAAVREGKDEANGVQIDIRPPAGGSPDSLKLLATQRADVAVLDIHDLGIAREKGTDVVAIGALVQKPLAAVISRADRPILVPTDLEGKRVGVAGLPSDDAVLKAIVEAGGGDFNKVKRVTIGFAAVANLLAGKVDAVTAFWNAEGVVLKERGLRTLEFRVDQFGAPPYPEVVLVVRRDTLEKRRDDLKKVLTAIAEGTEAALADQPATVKEVAAAADADEALTKAQLDAVAPVMEPPVKLDRTAIEGWAEFAAEFGILERPADVDEAFDFELFGAGE
jgi:NitT/TauT family transport system substrate-binding protein/putative hydroxymethylpyrimidine transport system substrate-binding protein